LAEFGLEVWGLEHGEQRTERITGIWGQSPWLGGLLKLKDFFGIKLPKCGSKWGTTTSFQFFPVF